MHKFLWVEGIDFDEHIDDTNQLPIIRGSSLALASIGTSDLALGGATFSGSSSALFKISGEGTRFSVGEETHPLKHLRFSQGYGGDVDEAKAIRIAQARARFGQITGDFVRKELECARNMCQLTRKLPGRESITLSEDQIKRLNIGTDRKKGSISTSVSAQIRREYGKSARTEFFKTRLDFDDLEFTSDLQELASPAEKMGELPLSVRDRLALFYADGNSFSKIRAGLGGTAESLTSFSKAVNDVVLDRALRSILDYLRNGQADPANGTAVCRGSKNGQVQTGLRFEILICGGDEFCFVAPAWLGLKLAEIFFEAVENATLGPDPLQFKAGLVFANCKTPIRPLRQAAMALADACRQDRDNSIGIHAFESIQPTAHGFLGVRKAVFGAADKDPASFRASEFRTFLKGLNDLKSKKFPRSQLYKIIRAARWGNVRKDSAAADNNASAVENGTLPYALTSDSSKNFAASWVKDYKGPSSEAMETAFPDDCNYAVRAWCLAHLWDYVWEPIKHDQGPTT